MMNILEDKIKMKKGGDYHDRIKPKKPIKLENQQSWA